MSRETVNTESFGRIADRMHFAQGVKANGFLFCSGVIGFDPATGQACDSAEDEFRAAFGNIGELLGAAGAGFDDVVEMTTYHVAAATPEEHGANMAAFGRIKDEYLGAEPPFPAWTGITVTGLALPGSRAEIRIVAKLPG